MGPGWRARRRGLASRRRPRRVLERGLERQLERGVVAVAVVLVDPRDRAEHRRVEAAELAARTAHHHGRRVAPEPVVRAFERRRRVFGHHEVVELRELFAAAAQFSLEAVDRPNNCAWTLEELHRYDEVKTLMRKALPVARRVLGESAQPTLMMRWIYARALYKDQAASLDDLSEAVTALEETERVAKRVLGGAHPQVTGIGEALRLSREVLSARETPSGNA